MAVQSAGIVRRFVHECVARVQHWAIDLQGVGDVTKKPPKRRKELVGMPFNEGLERFIQTIPSELKEALGRLREDADDLDADIRASQAWTISRMKGRNRRGKKD